MKNIEEHLIKVNDMYDFRQLEVGEYLVKKQDAMLWNENIYNNSVYRIQDICFEKGFVFQIMPHEQGAVIKISLK